MDEMRAARERMIQEHLAARGIRDARLLDAFRRIPREFFVPEEHRPWAYADTPLPIGYGQTISQPYIVARMVSMLTLRGGERVLEVGAGSGYQAAILSLLAAEVHTIERIPALAARAAEALRAAGVENVFVHEGDGTLGWEAAAPYDAVLVAAAAPDVPSPLLEQLTEGGRLVIPVGGRGMQFLERWTREGKTFRRERDIAVSFVPLVGERGWGENFA